MGIRATMAVCLLVLAAACSTSTEASTTSSTAPPTTTATEKRCPPFLGADYLDKPASSAQVITGWFVEFRAAGTVDYGPTAPPSMVITGFDRNDTNCTVQFKVAAPISTVAVRPAAPAGPLTTVSDGTYLVGTDMEAGSYKSPGASGCYWARLKDDSGQKIIANNLGDGPARFTAKKGEYVEIARCTFTKV